MENQFFNGFENKEDIARRFEIPVSDLDDCEILFASYGGYAYEGDALVIFRGKDGNLYEVHGAHCSCYGLEGNWEPEITSFEALRHRKRDSFKTEHGEEATKYLLELIGESV